MGGVGASTNTVQKSDPWVNQQPYLQQGFQQANNIYQQGPFNYAASPYTTQAQNLTAQKAQDPNSLVGQSQSMLGNTISGQYLNPSSNPFFKASVQDALGQASSAFAGQYGGQAGNNLGNSGYQEALARGLGAAATNAYSNQYNTERQNQLSASQLAPSMDYANLNQLANVGAQQESRAYQQYQAPWQNLGNYNSMINGQYGSQTEKPYFYNPMANAMGLGLGGLALYNGASNAGLFGGGAASIFGGANAADALPAMAALA